MRLSTTTVVLFGFPSALLAQSAPGADTIAFVAGADSAARSVARRHGEEIWPGFRADTIPTLYVLPGRGGLLFGWHRERPAGYTPVAGTPQTYWQAAASPGAASTAVSLSGVPTAQVVLQRLDAPAVAATALHEGFHVFAGSRRTEGRRFGAGENAVLVATYPIFDVENESLFALEGQLLAGALAAPPGTTQRVFAARAAAVRRTRHARLDATFAAFDDASELNEGLAQYAYQETLRIIAAEGPTLWRAVAREHLARETAHLTTLADDLQQSIRLRYYQTGAAMARLLDLLGDHAWKQQLVTTNITLATALAAASGLDAPLQLAMRDVKASGMVAAAGLRASSRVAALTGVRRAQMDSVLRQPGIRLVLVADSLPARDFNRCGFDPQNLLQVTPHVSLHTRWWRPCGAGGTNAEFNGASVHDALAGTVTAIIGTLADVQLTSDGQPVVLRAGESHVALPKVQLVTSRVSVQAGRADVVLRGDTLLVRPRP